MEALSVGLELLVRLRTVGPYEEWLARTKGDSGLPPLVVARRPDPARDDPVALSRRLETAAAISREVDHQNIVHCFGRIEKDGVIAQLLEALEGISLATALDGSGPIATKLAVWIGRQIVEAVAHAHSLGQPHRGLNPEHVILTRHGQVKVDFGLAAESPSRGLLTSFVDLRYADPRWIANPAFHARLDVFAIGAMLWEMMTGRRYADAREATDGPYVETGAAPRRLEAILAEALGAGGDGFEDARSVADRLTRTFYADLDGDDERDGRTALGAWIRATAQREIDAFEKHGDRARLSSVIPTAIDASSFDRLVEELKLPVRPQPMTRDDMDLGSEEIAAGSGTPASWTPGLSLESRLALRSDRETVGVPHVTGLDGAAAAAARPTERIDPAQLARALAEPIAPAAPEVAPTAPAKAFAAPAPKDFAAPPAKAPRPSKFVWFTLGFTVTWLSIWVGDALIR